MTQGKRKVVNDDRVIVTPPVEEICPLWKGVTTTIVGDIEKATNVIVLEDKGIEWLTDKGLVPKKYLLLEKI